MGLHARAEAEVRWRVNSIRENPLVDCRPNPTGLGLVDCIDTAAFALPAPLTFGNAARNMLRGLGSKVTDITLRKTSCWPDERQSRSGAKCSTSSTR